jgi:hypothetical protein
MADTVVTFLLQNLLVLLKEEANFLAGVKYKVNSLHDELSFINIFLESSAEKRKDKREMIPTQILYNNHTTAYVACNKILFSFSFGSCG